MPKEATREGARGREAMAINPREATTALKVKEINQQQSLRTIMIKRTKTISKSIDILIRLY